MLPKIQGSRKDWKLEGDKPSVTVR